jgi:hypothetical protein
VTPLQDEFDAHKAVEEAQERGEHAGEAKFRGILLLAALVAVIAAIASLLSNQHATAALQAKNEAILDQAHATDAWNFYEARSIKQHIYQAASDAASQLSATSRAQLAATAKHEGRDQGALLKQAQQYEAQVEVDNRRSEELMHRHEILEASVTFFEVSIAIVSIAGIVASRWLVGVGIVVALIGFGFGIYSFVPTLGL